MTTWTWTYDGYEPDQVGLREALCTVGNGYVATRGAAPETWADGVHYPGTYAAGIYNRLTSEVAGREVENESLVNLPNWLPLTFRIEGGPWFHIDEVEVLEQRQTLDLRCAVLTRHVRFRDAEGRTTTLNQRRFAAMDRPHVLALETTLLAEDWSGAVEVRSLIDAGVENSLVERYRALGGRHLELKAACELSGDSVMVEVATNRSHIRVGMAARTTVADGDGPLVVARSLVRDGERIGHLLAMDLAAGRAVTIDKVVTVYTSRDTAIAEPATTAARWLALLPGVDDLLPGHIRAWRALWDRFHLDLAVDERALRILRLHLVHLLQTASPNTADLDVGVPPRGLHGEAYRGHIFWDEVFVLPVLTLRLPALTRGLLLYRYRRLDEARAAARAAGVDGAMYPWQSGSDGREENQELHQNPVSGRWLPDPTHRQRHVGLAVAYNVWHYHQATGDDEFLSDHGAELLIEIARFWASIATFDHARDRYVIRGVMGPDEFHSGYPDGPEEGIENNAYTNVMAVWVLHRTRDALELLPADRRDELLDLLEVTSDELDRWQDIGRKMFVPFHDGIISQFEGCEDLEELDWAGYRERYGDIHRLDRILEGEDDSVNRYKAFKQADVVMLFYLLSADELTELLHDLGYDWEPERIPATIDHYMARTSHGSTLSAVVHAWVLARSRREQAVELFTQALDSDVADVQGGTTAEGIHLGAMAGTVDLVQRCYTGIETRGDRLILNPALPTQLTSVRFGIRYRGHQLDLCFTHGETRIEARRDGDVAAIQVEVSGTRFELAPGGTLTVPTAE